MDFRKALEKEHSKTITSAIVMEICNTPKKMDELMQIFIDGPYRISQRAAWPFSFVAEKHPELLNDYYPILVKLLYQEGNHPAINRNIMRAFQYAKIPEKHQGKILNRCFEFLKDSNQPIAIKVFSMTVAFNLSKIYPDIIPELKASIETLMPDGSAGLKNRGNKILKSITKS